MTGRVTKHALVALSCACAAPVEKPTYDELVRTCELEEGRPVVERGGQIVHVEAACAEVLGQVLGLDWESFDAMPAASDTPETTIELLIAGAMIVVAPDQPLVEEVLAMDPPAAFQVELRERASALPPGARAGELWFELLRTWIDHTAYDGAMEAQMSMVYGQVKVGDLTIDPDDAPFRTPLYVGSILIHEASHRFLHGHVQCPLGEASCDVDIEGTNGAEAWWRSAWLASHLELIDESMCTSEVENLETTCRGISADRRTDFEPCVDVEKLCGAQSLWPSDLEHPTPLSSPLSPASNASPAPR